MYLYLPFPTPIILEYGYMWDLFTMTNSIVSDARNKGIWKGDLAFLISS